MEVYVSLTTIPSRLFSLERCIDSLLTQTVKPDKIFISVPRKYNRFNAIIDDRDIPKFKDSTIHPIRCNDMGPGTKLLGPLDYLSKNSLIILVDDDCTYKEYMIEELLKHFHKDPKVCYSFYTYTLKRDKTYTIGQGADCFAIPCNILDKVRLYFDLVKRRTELLYHDDLWISFYLYLLNYPIISLESALRDSDTSIYEIYNDTDGLVYLEQDYARWNLNKNGVAFLEDNESRIRKILRYTPTYVYKMAPIIPGIVTLLSHLLHDGRIKPVSTKY